MNQNQSKKEIVLDPFEAKLEKSFSDESWVELTNEEDRQKAVTAAKAVKSERTNIRLSLEDVIAIKKKAREYGLGYQTLIASVIHQYVTGRLIEADKA